MMCVHSKIFADYCPFGMAMGGRFGSVENYRYSFQGQEKDDEIKGKGNSINYKFRMHDPRLGRFFAVDPLYKDFPWNSTYAFSENRVTDAVELEGLESARIHLQEFAYEDGTTQIEVVEELKIIPGGVGGIEYVFTNLKGETHSNFLPEVTITGTATSNSEPEEKITPKPEPSFFTKVGEEMQKADNWVQNALENYTLYSVNNFLHEHIDEKKLAVVAVDVATEIHPLFAIPKATYTLTTGTNPITGNKADNIDKGLAVTTLILSPLAIVTKGTEISKTTDNASKGSTIFSIGKILYDAVFGESDNENKNSQK